MINYRNISVSGVGWQPFEEVTLRAPLVRFHPPSSSYLDQAPTHHQSPAPILSSYLMSNFCSPSIYCPISTSCPPSGSCLPRSSPISTYCPLSRSCSLST